MDDIEAILKATIQTKVVEAFNQTPEMIDKLVAAALSKEVDEHGQKPSSYGSMKMPYMDWLVGDEIRRAVTACVREHIEEHKDEFKARISESLMSADYAKPLGETIAKMLSDEWRWSVDLKISEDR